MTSMLAIGTSAAFIISGIFAAVIQPEGWLRLEVLLGICSAGAQLLALQVAGRCNHPLNQLAAYACFSLFCIQPWTTNEWMWALATQRGGYTSFTPEHKRLVRSLTILLAMSLGSRALPCLAPFCHNCDPSESLCSGSGPACALEGHWHAYWRVPLRPAGPLMAGVWAHVALTYVPTLANGGRYLSFERVLTLLLLCTGVGSALLLCGDNVHEVPALWTLIVLPQRVLGAALAHAYKDDAVIARRVPLTQLPGTGKELPTSKSKRRDRSKVGGISGERGGDEDELSDLSANELDDVGKDGDDENISEDSSDEDEAESLIRYGPNGQLRRRKKL